MNPKLMALNSMKSMLLKLPLIYSAMEFGYFDSEIWFFFNLSFLWRLAGMNIIRFILIQLCRTLALLSSCFHCQIWSVNLISYPRTYSERIPNSRLFEYTSNWLLKIHFLLIFLFNSFIYQTNCVVVFFLIHKIQQKAVIFVSQNVRCCV